jgi:ABC-type transport system involved in multi-copper enzyme maturation permease subunit
MLLGPIFQVEIVSTARRRRYFALRVLYGALILFVLWAAYEASGTLGRYQGQHTSLQASSRLAATFFLSFSWLQMMAILAVGPAMAVGTIATERERRTIEYLFATDLANHEIVLGKTIARLMLLGKLVLVGLPVLFLFRLLGGIPADLLVSSFLLAGSTAVMIAALSICVSVWSSRARDATVRVYVALSALVFLPMMLRAFGSHVFPASALWQQVVMPAVEACLVINPISALASAISNPLAMGLGLDMTALLKTVGWQLVVAASALAWATAAVRRAHLGAVSHGERKHGRQFQTPRWRPALVNHPILWKEMFAGTAKTRLGIVGAVAIGLILIATYAVTMYNFLEALSDSRWRRPEDFFTYLAVLTGMMGSGMLLLLAARAAGLVTMEKERDCWTSLLATPLTGREIMTGKMWGNLYGMRWPLAVLVSVWALGVWIDPGFLWAALVMGFTFLLAAWYATNLGLSFSLRSGTTLRAMGATLGTLVFASGGYLFCCCVVMAGDFGGRGDEALMLAPCLPYLLAFPAIAYYDFFVGNFFARQTGFTAAYVLGMLLYLVVSGMLYAYMTVSFDRLVGRCGRHPDQK